MLGERGADQIERRGQAVSERGQPATRARGRPVLPQVPDDLRAEPHAERGREQRDQRREPPADGRAVRRRFSASAAAPLSRPASAASARRPAAGGVVAARQAGCGDSGPLGSALGDEARGHEPRDDAVERARLGRQAAVGLGLDVCFTA